MAKGKLLDRNRFNRIARVVRINEPKEDTNIAEYFGVSFYTVRRVRHTRTWKRYCEFKEQEKVYTKQWQDTKRLNSSLDSISSLSTDPTPKQSFWNRLRFW